MSKKNESGQIFVLAALSMMVLIGIAAFCMNASFMFYQHQRMQAMVDEQTRLASGNGCVSTWPSGSALDGGTIVISPTTFFGQAGSYCDGVYSKQAGGLFGNILRFPNKISVHAVAQHGGTTEKNFAILGLDPGSKSTDCSVNFSGGSNLTIDGDVESNSQGLYPTPCHGGSGTVSFTYPLTETYISSANARDPYEVTLPSVGSYTSVPCNTNPTCTYPNTGSLACLASPLVIPKGGVYYQPLAANVMVAPGDIKANNGDFLVYLPYCSGTTQSAGLYEMSSIKDSGGTIITTDSTLVLTTNTGLNIDSASVIDWRSPADGDLKGYALYEATPCTDQSSGTTESINGGAGFYVDGLIDVSCMNLKFSGGAGTTIKAILVAWSIDFTGSSGSVGFKPPTNSPPRGAFLVQ